MKKVSIIIPCYNSQNFIADTIDSCLTQTIKCEIIVVDDGSTDHSADICESYRKEKKIKLIRQINKGLPSARNTGIMAARGAYILPLDSDDLLKENAVEILLQNTKGYDVVVPSMKCFGVDNREVILGDFTLEELKEKNRALYCCLFKKNILLKVGGYNPKMDKGLGS